MIRIVFSGKDMLELSQQISAAAAGLNLGMTVDGARTLTPPQTEPQAAPEKKTRKSKEKVEASTPPPSVEAAPAATALSAPVAAATTEIPKTKLSEMLQKVSEKGGMPAARAVLSRFGVNRIGEVPQNRYADFLDECAKAIA